MIAHRHLTKILSALIAAALLLVLLALVYSERLEEKLGGKGLTLEYESQLFDTSEPIEIDLIMDEDQWEEMLSKALSESYYPCDVVINGTRFYQVGIRPKGNTSLSAIVNDPESERYSFKLEFDQYVEGQSCWGLDKLVLNNSYADYSYMKEALVYDMYQYLGADASLYNYASISVNGEAWGLYLALEAVEESFLLRNYGTSNAALYKPDSMAIGGGNFAMPDLGEMDLSQMMPPGGWQPGAADGETAGRWQSGAADGETAGGWQPDIARPDAPEGAQDFTPFQGAGSPSEDAGGAQGEGDMRAEGRPERDGFDAMPHGGGGLQMGGGGANLNYTDDALESYSAIWEGAVTNTSERDQRRVVTALKNSSMGMDLEDYMDVDNLLKYMAVHIFSVNEDSLSGSMAHNYYLCERAGQLNILPWDYNLAFGGMHGGAATDVVNDPIDMPFSSTQFFDPLLEDADTLARYHAYLGELVGSYIDGGAFDAFYTRTRSQIDALVQADPSAFCSYEEYLDAADMLYQLVTLRGASIQRQLDGSIPSTESGQRADSSTLIDASGLDLGALGTMFGGMGGGAPSPAPSKRSSEETGENPSPETGEASEGFARHTPAAAQAGGLEALWPGDGQLPEDFDRSALEDILREHLSDLGATGSAAADPGSTLITYGICLALLLGAMILAARYRRRPYRRGRAKKS